MIKNSFFRELEKVKVPTWNHIGNRLSDREYPAPELVRVVKSDQAFFKDKIPSLETVLTLGTPVENNILKAYYELLKPEGIIFFPRVQVGLIDIVA